MLIVANRKTCGLETDTCWKSHSNNSQFSRMYFDRLNLFFLQFVACFSYCFVRSIWVHCLCVLLFMEEGSLSKDISVARIVYSGETLCSQPVPSRGNESCGKKAYYIENENPVCGRHSKLKQRE